MARKPAIQKDFFGNILIEVEVHPNSSRSAITGYNEWRNRLQISTKSLAIKGEANREMIEIISKSFDLQKSQIEIVKGQTSRLKQVKLSSEEIEIISKKLIEIIAGD
jgi:uncharacterized protein (TIGR00251 family)